MKKLEKDLLHYAVVFAALALSWVPIMDAFQGNVWPTLAVSFVVFIAADKLAHKFVLGE